MRDHPMLGGDRQGEPGERPAGGADAGCVLAVNRGSSSLKFALYERDGPEALRLQIAGQVERIGRPDAVLSAIDRRHDRKMKIPVDAPGHGEAAGQLILWLERQIGFRCIRAVGHRVVHGGARYWRPELVTPGLLDYLRDISSFDPEHLPVEIALIEAFQRWGDLPQVACFDTAFHHDLPPVARRLPIPRHFEQWGVRRYGFHGLSYAYLMQELAAAAGAEAARGRVILAHLGAGASMAAVRGGQSRDTTMAFTPTAGLPMATRSGDLDPGLGWFLARETQMGPKEFHEMVNQQSGLLGVSETSGDMRELLAREPHDPRAAEAVAMFCYHCRKWIGALAAALEGLETLVFSGGIGANSPILRARICEGLAFLGIRLDTSRNAANARLVSPDDAAVSVRVIPTDEERMIAEATWRVVAALPASVTGGGGRWSP